MSKFTSLISQLLLIFVLATSFTACTGSRKAVRAPIKEEGAEFLINKLKDHELRFNRLSAKFNITYQVDSKTTNVSGNLRIEYDSIIWISISPALGLEAVRFMLTPDSIKYINRLNKTYLSQDFVYINQLLNKTLDYDMAQSFLIGNDFSLYESNSFKASIENQQYKLNTINRRKIRRYVRRSEDDISIPIQSIWLDPENFKISKVLLKEAERDNRKFIATYEDFNNIDGRLIPADLEFNIETDVKKVRIKVRYSNIQFEQDQTYPFRIPENYTEIKDLQSKK